MLKKIFYVGIIISAFCFYMECKSARDIISFSRHIVSVMEMKYITTMLTCHYAIENSYPMDFEKWMGKHFKRSSFASKLPGKIRGKEYIYFSDGQHYKLINIGKDRKLGTSDDLAQRG